MGQFEIRQYLKKRQGRYLSAKEVATYFDSSNINYINLLLNKLENQGDICVKWEGKRKMYTFKTQTKKQVDDIMEELTKMQAAYPGIRRDDALQILLLQELRRTKNGTKTIQK
jgi:hypothetical protein